MKRIYGEKKMYFWVLLYLAYFQFNFGTAQAQDKEDAFEKNRSTFSTRQHLINHNLEDNPLKENHMAWTKHLQYTTGAFGGAIVGSFLVNVFDTIAARKFALIKASSWKVTAKSVIASYIPVLIGVVPMRALSFGVYSVCQESFGDFLSFGLNKTISAALSGLSLSILTTPAEVLKTRRQIESRILGFTIKDIRGSFIPLASRVVPTVTCMLAGTEGIQTILPVNNIFISTAIASIVASSLSQIVGTPAENIRTYRIKELDYQTSTIDLIKKIKRPRLYAGFWHRSFALGTQATFTLVCAKLAS